MTSGASPSRLAFPDGSFVPAAAVRVALAVVGSLLSLAVHGLDGWAAAGAALSVIAACAPQLLLAWLLILFLAAGRIARHPALDWRLLVLLAGAHLLHVLGMLTLELPSRGRVAPEVFVAPLRRYVTIQVPAQLLAVLCLVLLAPTAGGHRPITAAALGVLGAVALAGVIALLFGRGEG